MLERVSFMGIVNQNLSRSVPPPVGFQMPAFRYHHSNWRHTQIVIPVPVNDRIRQWMIYDTTQPGCHPIWNDGQIGGATMFFPNQPALYAFRFPNGQTYVALKELIIGRIRRWLEETPEEMLNCPLSALEEARKFCSGHLPASLDKQMAATAGYASKGAYSSIN